MLRLGIWVFVVATLAGGSYMGGDACCLLGPAIFAGTAAAYLAKRPAGRPHLEEVLATAAAAWAIASSVNAVRGYPDKVLFDEASDLIWIALHAGLLWSLVRLVRARRSTALSLVPSGSLLLTAWLLLDTPLLTVPSVVARQLLGRRLLDGDVCSIRGFRYFSKIDSSNLYAVTYQPGAAVTALGTKSSPRYVPFARGGSMDNQYPALHPWLLFALDRTTGRWCPP